MNAFSRIHQDEHDRSFLYGSPGTSSCRRLFACLDFHGSRQLQKLLCPAHDWRFIPIQGFSQKDAEITESVDFDVSIDENPAGCINMGLYGGTVPKTVENLKQLCTGDDRYVIVSSLA